PGRLIVAAEVDAHRPRVVADLADGVAQVILRQHLLDGSEPIAPVFVVLAGDGARFTLLGGFVKKEGPSRNLTGRGRSAGPVISASAESATLSSIARLGSL